MDPGHVVFGYSCCLVAGVGFAVNYLPVKRVDTGDGVFFAASMSIGIVLVGVATGFAAGAREEMVFPKFEPLAAVGGAIWMLGNLMCPYIIRLIGLGLGITVWDLSNMITGWFTGFFGWFGVRREPVARPALNCVGVGLAAFSLVFFSLAASADKAGAGAREVKEGQSPGPGLGERSPTESTVDSSGAHADVSPADMEAAKEVSVNWEDVEARRAGPGPCAGFGAGVDCRGLLWHNLRPSHGTAQGELGPDHSPRILDYVPSHFIGIFATAVLALLVYVAVMGRKSYTPKQIVLPAIASGVLWGIAQVAWFQANAVLGLDVAFPIIASLPGILGLVIGMFLFGEVKTSRSRLMASLGLLLRLPGVALIATST